MASLAKQLMDEFALEARRANDAGNYGRQFVYQNAENLVNNVMHGRPFAEVAAAVRAALTSNAERASATERADYLAARDLLDLFVAVSA